MEFNIWLLLAGIGILLFGMNVFEHAIRFLGGNKLKGILQKYTKNGWTSIFTWFWTTSVLQSSSLLSLLILAFAGAGVLALKNAIGLIFWANIGSPMLPLLAALIGFGSFKISAFALPMIAIWGLSLIFNLSEKQEQRAKLFVWFGLLFLGLDFMKDSMDAIKASFDLTQYADMSLWKFGILGVIVTLVIQSSGALWVMTLAALDGGLISFPASIAIAMGSNIGTTFTAVIWSLGGSRIKRQIATSHVIFNVLSWVIGIVLFWQYIRFTNEVLWFADDPIMGNAVLNIVFNASTAILFGFFLLPFTKLVQKLVPMHKDEDTLRIEQTQMSTKVTGFSLAQIHALHEDSKTLIDQVFDYNSYVFGFDKSVLHDEHAHRQDVVNKTQAWDKKTHAAQYTKLKHTSDIMLEHLLPAKGKSLHQKDRELLEHIEKTIYTSTQSAKSIKNIYRDIQDLQSSSNKTMKTLTTKVLINAATFYQHVAHIIDRKYSTKNFEELSDALHAIEADHEQFIDYLTQELSAELTKEELQELNIPTLLNLDHYLYQSAKRLVTAIQHTYLGTEEEKVFKELKIAKEG